ncbi:MAG: glycosyltransferase [Deltaproteobacteria bacterium SG8_13]|nr:MAG: glycosyltransferase [Deltaproteobacteria bacterium SG8_13]
MPVWGNVYRGSPEGPLADRISIIIPALNEVATIKDTILSLQGARNIEVIVVDGGSHDGTAQSARQLGVSVLQSNPGRAVQMNAGAAHATGDILLFLHADTKLSPGFENYVRSAAGKPGVSAGAFTLQIDSSLSSLRIMERVANLRSRYARMPYGDQGIFVSAALFDELGGFADMPIMEDFEFIRRLQKKGRIEIIPAVARTSARRWLSVGIWRTWWINQIMVAGFYLGVSPQRLAAFYRRAKGRG